MLAGGGLWSKHCSKQFSGAIWTSSMVSSAQIHHIAPCFQVSVTPVHEAALGVFPHLHEHCHLVLVLFSVGLASLSSLSV